MKVKSSNREFISREGDLYKFARSYLSSAFPNQERKGCPSEDALSALATHSSRDTEWITNHLTCCSPCFNSYMAHLAGNRTIEVKDVNHAWVFRPVLAAVSVALALLGVYIGLHNLLQSHHSLVASDAVRTQVARPNDHSATGYLPVFIDLTEAAPVRGPGASKHYISQQTIPQVQLAKLTLQLPIGSQQSEYELKLSSQGHVFWSASAESTTEGGVMLLHLEADLSHLPAGRYELIVLSKEFRVVIPVLLKPGA